MGGKGIRRFNLWVALRSANAMPSRFPHLSALTSRFPENTTLYVPPSVACLWPPRNFPHPLWVSALHHVPQASPPRGVVALHLLILGASPHRTQRDTLRIPTGVSHLLRLHPLCSQRQ